MKGFLLSEGGLHLFSSEINSFGFREILLYEERYINALLLSIPLGMKN